MYPMLTLKRSTFLQEMVAYTTLQISQYFEVELGWVWTESDDTLNKTLWVIITYAPLIEFIEAFCGSFEQLLAFIHHGSEMREYYL